MRPFAKFGNWNMLEQELLKSFFETKHDGRVYAFAAGYLEMTVSNRARCEEKPEESALSRHLWLQRTDAKEMVPNSRSKSIS